MQEELRIARLRDQWDRAVERDKPKDALAALVELEQLEPKDARWAQRAGDAHRRLGRTEDAIAAFERAALKYAAQGFLPRAIAMAKLVASIEPARTDVLAKLDPNAARALRAPVAHADRPSIAKAAKPLERAPAAQADEVRFEDVEEPAPPSIAISVREMDLHAAQPDLSADRLASMAGAALFADVSDATLAELSLAAELVEKPAGEIVFARNAAADALYVIVEGSVRVSAPGVAPVVLGEGEVFGEGCLLEEGVRQADVHADGALVALAIPKRALDVIVADHRELDDVLFELLVSRLVSNVLATSELFAAFDPTSREQIARLFEVRRGKAGTILAEAGKKSDGLYLLLAGHAAIERDGRDGREDRVARGALFGQRSLVSRDPADATIRAKTELLVLRLPASKFNALATEFPPALSHLAETAASPVALSVPPPKPDRH